MKKEYSAKVSWDNSKNNANADNFCKPQWPAIIKKQKRRKARMWFYKANTNTGCNKTDTPRRQLFLFFSNIKESLKIKHPFSERKHKRFKPKKTKNKKTTNKQRGDQNESTQVERIKKTNNSTEENNRQNKEKTN